LDIEHIIAKPSSVDELARVLAGIFAERSTQ